MPEDVFYTSEDGLKLHARCYGDPEAPLTALCMHGLTRNHKDFEPMIAALGNRHRYVSVDVRGRALSDRARSSDQYNPIQYADDMIALLDHMGLSEVALIGTSMGGLMAMFLMDKIPERISGVVMNDIGPVVEHSGLLRISEYASQTPVYDGWQTAATSIARTQITSYPEYQSEDWEAFAHRTCREKEDGWIVPDFDPKIMDGFTTEPPSRMTKFAMWRLFGKLKSRPLLILRGEHSDILSAKTATMMERRHGGATLITVPGRGHAPMLDETEAVAAISGFLDGVLLTRAGKAADKLAEAETECAR